MTTHTLESIPQTQRRSWLDRSLPMTGVHLEVMLYIVVVVLSIIAHLWRLDVMALHHDESIHAWSSWNYYMGKGGFNCYGGHESASYCYDPVYHGPSLYMTTLLSYFLFGDGEAQARLPMAVAGIVMVASCWMLRPLIGRRGAFIAAVLVGFSPSLLYYTRFARHDGLMVLWELWMVVSVFRYVDTGKPGYLYLLSASLALAIGTHELYYILFFIFGVFIFIRLMAEIRFTERFLSLVLLILLGVCAVLIILNPPLPIGKGLYLGEKAFLLGSALLLVWVTQRVWHPEPVIIPRLKDLWQNQRFTLWIAAAIFLALYLVMYTNFFSYPRGALDGMYAGLAYWLGSQQDYARGDQPWYYYLMQLPIYEPLGIITSIGAMIYLFIRPVTRMLPLGKAGKEDSEETLSTQEVATADTEQSPATANMGQTSATTDAGSEIPALSQGEPIAASVLPLHTPTVTIFPLLLVFWYIMSIIIFSWAGEKMPWLLVHMALPGNLVAAWVLGKLFDSLEPKEAEPSPNRSLLLAVPPLVFVTIVSFAVAFWRLYSPGEGQEAQRNLLQGLVPLIIGGALLYTLLTIGQKSRMRAVLALTGLTMAMLVGAYMIRASWMVVYDHPDTPIEPLIYTQSSPDIPRYVQDMEILSLNLTRNYRSDDDVTGGLSMPIVVDNGDENGGGSLAWPLQWYFRHFRKLTWKSAKDFQEPTAKTFEVTMPDGSKGLAPVIMVYKHHITNDTREFFHRHYVQPYGPGGSLNWWFPEGDKCSPNGVGYKKFYFQNWKNPEKLKEQVTKDCGKDISGEVHSPLAPLLWAFQGENWETLKDYMLYRTLPPDLKPGSRDLEVWVRRDLLAGTGLSSQAANDVTGIAMIHLLARQSIGAEVGLNGPTGIAVDGAGKVYIADTQNHRVVVFDADGEFERSIGTYGKGEGQFDEPRGIAVDAEGNMYVADTWNARIVKLDKDGNWLTTWGSGSQDIGNQHMATITGATQEGNAASPLGFFGPRGIALDADGRVYVADTGNKRIVVTDASGEYLYQWGYDGSGLGKFNEPTGVSIDESGNVYVADTWNSRVQIFSKERDGNVSAVPSITWGVSAWESDTYYDPSLGVAPDGTVFVSVPNKHYVQAVNMRGDVLLRWGGEGGDLAALVSPSGIATGPDGDVFVVDRKASRVLRFELPAVRPAVKMVDEG